MDFSRRTAQLLHEDHRETIALVESLDDLIANARKSPPDVGNARTRKTLKAASEMIGHEIRRHFAFEENELFTRLETAGDIGIATHLREEHQAILPLGERIEALSGRALSDGFSAEGWQEFRQLGGELIERMLAHIQKEEMALLPMLDELLDPETDLVLSETFASV
jgi:hemerythrin-like domain-containing protein